MTDTWTNLGRARTFGSLLDWSPSRTVDHPIGCPCPVCVGLHTFERPRFFAGQLLTEAELTLLESYMIDKHRLHNVHLHGWGVVCGLQVRCDDCGDGIVVESGYAIDPCGNDIVVPVTQRVDVLRMIQQCVQQTTPACDPPRYQLPEECDNTETWCVTVKYREWNTRAVTPLGSGAVSTTCSCGKRSGKHGGCSCGGAKPARPGWECTCGAGGSANAQTCSCGGTGLVSTTSTTPECEPSRTQELYEFGVCRSDGSCNDLAERLRGTFPLEAIECVTKLRPILTKHMSTKSMKSVGTLVLNEEAAEADHESVCSLYDALLEIYRTDPMRTMCTLPDELTAIDCSPQGPNEADDSYRNRVASAAQALVVLLVAYVRDCICYHLLPPCPPAVCDDRVILACLTVRDGKVVDICNFECRRFAGSFVSRNYWLPIGPIVSYVIGLLCCYPLLGRIKGRRETPIGRLRLFMAQQRTASLRKAITKDDFALVQHWLRRAKDAPSTFRLDSLLTRADRAARPIADGVNLSAYYGMTRSDAHTALHAENVAVTRTEVLAGEEPTPAGLGAFPTAQPGDRLIAYERDGRVVGFARDLSKARRTTKKNP